MKRSSVSQPSGAQPRPKRRATSGRSRARPRYSRARSPAGLQSALGVEAARPAPSPGSSSSRPESPPGARAPRAARRRPVLASARTASGNESRSWRIRKPKASPPTPQPKQWKMPFCGIDHERGRLLAVEGAEALPVRAGLAQVHEPADQIDDVDAGPDLVEQRRRVAEPSADLQRGHGGAGAALGRLAVAERLDQGMAGQQVADRLAQGAGALAVDQSYAGQARP